VDVTSTARSVQEVVSSVKGGTRVTMIDLHRLSSGSPTHSTPTPTLPPPPRRCYPRGLSRHRVPQDRPPPPLAICFAQSPRKQYDVTHCPLPALSTPAKKNQTFNNLQRRPTTYARMTNRLRAAVFSPVVLCYFNPSL